MENDKLEFTDLIKIKCALKLFHILSDGSLGELDNDRAFQKIDFLIHQEKINVAENHTDPELAKELHEKAEKIFIKQLDNILEEIQINKRLLEIQEKSLNLHKEMIEAQHIGIKQLLK